MPIYNQEILSLVACYKMLISHNEVSFKKVFKPQSEEGNAKSKLILV